MHKSTSLQLYTGYTVAQSKNRVNDSDLRNIENRGFYLNLVGRTSFKTNVNFENTTAFTNNHFLLDRITQNQISALTNSLKSIYKINPNFKTNVVFNFIATDLATNNHYFFIDAEITFTSKNKKFDYSIIGRNLTNNTTFETISISDYSRSISSHNLIERFVMASVSFKF